VHPILYNRERLILYLTAWLPIAALLTAILARGDDIAWWEGLAIGVPMCFFYAFICLSSWYLCRTPSLRSRATLPMIGTLMLASFFCSAVWVLMGRSWVGVLEILPPFAGLSQRFVSQAGVLFLAGVLLFLLAVAVHYLLLMLEESRAAEKNALKLQVLAREAELRALRAQIDPHFLFNSLNSISALALQDPRAARKMCNLLADFMRTSLAIGNKDRVTLSEELKLTEGFLDIEKVRFGSRLSVDYNVEPECRDCLVPPLFIQPLVENAVTHGIAPLVDGGLISIEARVRSAMLEITIENPRDSESQSSSGTGLGIRNVRERLTNIFAENARLEVAKDDQRFRVGVRIPCIRNGVQS
jgi:two-component system sensor histidine kinase AlgZ